MSFLTTIKNRARARRVQWSCRDRVLTLIAFSFLLLSCVSKPPSDVDNVCRIFKQYPRWYRDAKDVERRWRVPVAVQMAIIHQESRFNARAKPPRTKLLWIIPFRRPSSAYGYAQALRPTWRQYKKARDGGSLFAARDEFDDAVDFIGWYANRANHIAHVPRYDAYNLYLAYHEGTGGYLRRTYLQKPWLIQVARKVKARSQLYQAQLERCTSS